MQLPAGQNTMVSSCDHAKMISTGRTHPLTTSEWTDSRGAADGILRAVACKGPLGKEVGRLDNGLLQTNNLDIHFGLSLGVFFGSRG